MIFEEGGGWVAAGAARRRPSGFGQTRLPTWRSHIFYGLKFGNIHVMVVSHGNRDRQANQWTKVQKCAQAKQNWRFCAIGMKMFGGIYFCWQKRNSSEFECPARLSFIFELNRPAEANCCVFAEIETSRNLLRNGRSSGAWSTNH